MASKAVNSPRAIGSPHMLDFITLDLISLNWPTFHYNRLNHTTTQFVILPLCHIALYNVMII